MTKWTKRAIEINAELKHWRQAEATYHARASFDATVAAWDLDEIKRMLAIGEAEWADEQANAQAGGGR